jgi:hypothetical protein
MTETEEHPPTSETVAQGYEPPDINVRGVVVFLMIFLVGAIIIQVGLWGVLKVYSGLPRTADIVTSAAPPPARFLPPNLQPTEQHNQFPWQDLAQLRQEKTQIFDQLGWKTDPETQTPLIPDAIIAQLRKERPAPAPSSSTDVPLIGSVPSVTDDTHTGVPQ